ncbi:H /oligopeptide symporter [Ceraceosorus bombacis]|uniref:H /oligopeptide symporter n=1 Tax=Ceraceosorus bombacis TaxID=401625 RepID=A0A0P1BIH9_9BASI|nr:H /oligopeptide symporter [Ceraceosorus bombacis]
MAQATNAFAAAEAELANDIHQADLQQSGLKSDIHPLGHLEPAAPLEKAVVSDDEYGPLPTDEDRINLRRVPEKIPWTAYIISFCELAERLSYYGTTVVFQNFIQQPLPAGSRTGAPVNPDDQPGALGRGQQAATAGTTFNTFWVYVCPLFGAYIAEKYIGRYKTIVLSVLIAIAGHVILIGSAAPDLLVNNPQGAYGVFWLAIIIMGLGTGGFKSNISPLIAEQVPTDRQHLRTLPSGERVIVDPALTTGRLFAYFYLFINIGAVVGQVSISYTEKLHGFWQGYLIPTAVFALCLPVMAFGSRFYVKNPPNGSVLEQSCRLIAFCMKGTFSWNPVRFYKNLTAADFWSKGKPSRIAPEQRPSWMTFDDIWVEEVRKAIKACQVFTLYPFYWITYNQISSNLISQAYNMKKNGVPNEVISNLDPISIIILVPLFDLVIYPFMRKLKINFSPIKRIVAGFACGAASMVAAAVIQHYIYQRSPCGDYATECDNVEGPGFLEGETDLNVWIQTVPYVFVGLSEVFASITGLEVAFTLAPKNMKSIVMSLFLLTNAFGAAIQQALLPLTVDPLLVWQYVTCALLSAIAGVLTWFLFRGIDRETDRLANLPAGTAMNATNATGAPTSSNDDRSSHDEKSHA